MINEYAKFNDQVIDYRASNGMKVVLIPRPKYQRVFATLTAAYGASNRKLKIGNQLLEIPAGTAHFLEHKLFEKENYDAFDLFGKNGADANAFTNQAETTYLFSATNKIQQNLDNLLDFVYNPYFTEKTVQKEQGIIGQEIMMYDDLPEWRLYNQFLANLYPNQPLANDIAGSVESIAEITADILYQIHQAYYQPNNLTLKIAGNFDIETIKDWIEQNISHQKNQSIDFQSINSFSDQPIIKEQTITMENVIQPKIAIGAKGLGQPTLGPEGLKKAYSIELLADLLFGARSDWYQRNYQTGLIDSSFDFDYEIQASYHYFSINAQTDYPQKLQQEFFNQIEIDNLNHLIANKDNFQKSKKSLLGDLIKQLDSLENLVLSSSERLFGLNLFQEIEIVEKIDQTDLKTVVNNFQEADWSSLLLMPKD